MRPAVELFGASWCEPCAKVKQLILGTNPAGHGVSYTYIDVGEDPEYAMKRLPVVFVGDKVMEGPTLAQVSVALDNLYDSLAPKPATVQPAEMPKPVPATGSTANSNTKLIVGGVFVVLGFLGHSHLTSH